MLKFDHLVIGAHTLEQGRHWFAACLGVDIPDGGSHPLMGTHNLLTATGNDGFAEIIAIDPLAQVSRTRWFSLDDPLTTDRLRREPHLLTWVAGTSDLDSAVEEARVAGFNPGDIIHMTRGDLTWRLTVPADGSLAADGAFPALIEWPGAVHPSNRMQDTGVRVESIVLRHENPGLLERALHAIGASALVAVESRAAGQPSMSATLRRHDTVVVI